MSRGRPVTSCSTTTGSTGSSNVATYTCVLTVSKAGTYVVAADYPGDTDYPTVTSAADSVMVAKATPSNVVDELVPDDSGPERDVYGDGDGSDGWSYAVWDDVVECERDGGDHVVLDQHRADRRVERRDLHVRAYRSKAGTYVVSAAYPGDGNYVTVTSAADTGPSSRLRRRTSSRMCRRVRRWARA